jgi:hypothetical protein
MTQTQTAVERIEAELAACEAEALRNGWEAPWMPTEEDMDAVIEAIGHKPTAEQWIEAGRRWGVRWVGDAHVAEASCIYCDAAVRARADVPALDDDATWRELASEHFADCEWVQTRAHRVEEVR